MWHIPKYTLLTFLYTTNAPRNFRILGALLVWLLSQATRLVELSELVVRAEHVNDLVLVHLLHEVASGTAVLTRVELTWLVVEYLTNSSGECET